VAEGAAPHIEHELTGCRPEPLGSYLKALGVLKLLATQKDRSTKGFWRGDTFVIKTVLARDEMMRFFLNEWHPTPVVAPWNGGSGFYPKDNREAADAILKAGDPRLAEFAASIAVGRTFVAARGWSERPEGEEKLLMLRAMRARLPDEALAWLDAAVVIGDDRLLFPPLLGTGGNDGRLDFSNNYQQRVVEVLSSREPDALASALFGTFASSRFKGAMGQYQPAANERSNPWDFVLLIEGSLMFAGAATRRFETSLQGGMSFPFHARSAGASTTTDSDEDEGRDELWLPLWSKASAFAELQALFSEGRAKVGAGDRARAASSGLDFARAVTSLGVARGIDEFSRVGLLVRNGLAYFATPLGRYETGAIRSGRLLDEIDRWHETFRRRTTGRDVPARVGLARRNLERAVFEASATTNLAPLLLALGDAEKSLGQSAAFAADAGLYPVPRLSEEWWPAVADGSVEQRLGAALAARRSIRRRILPVDGAVFTTQDRPSVVFTDRSLTENLHALLRREQIEADEEEGVLPVEQREARCTLDDIAAFIDGAVDDQMIERWLRAATLVPEGGAAVPPEGEILPPALYATLALVQNGRVRDDTVPRSSALLANACGGDAYKASAAAIRRLNAAGCPIPVNHIIEPAGRTRRIAAALAFPLSYAQRRALERMVLPKPDEETHAAYQESA